MLWNTALSPFEGRPSISAVIKTCWVVKDKIVKIAQLFYHTLTVPPDFTRLLTEAPKFSEIKNSIYIHILIVPTSMSNLIYISIHSAIFMWLSNKHLIIQIFTFITLVGLSCNLKRPLGIKMSAVRDMSRLVGPKMKAVFVRIRQVYWKFRCNLSFWSPARNSILNVLADKWKYFQLHLAIDFIFVL